MFIVREKASKIVRFLSTEECTIEADGLHGAIRALDVKAATHEVVTGDAPPMRFIPGLLTFNTSWAIADADAYAIATAPPKSEVEAYRDELLAKGFTYDFGDARGVHHIGTTEDDLRKWREVTDISNAAINAGIPNQPIGITTDTGPAVVTASEWQLVLLAAGAHRQPIYAAYFAVKAMTPIPADFRTLPVWPA